MAVTTASRIKGVFGKVLVAREHVNKQHELLVTEATAAIYYIEVDIAENTHNISDEKLNEIVNNYRYYRHNDTLPHGERELKIPLLGEVNRTEIITNINTVINFYKSNNNIHDVDPRELELLVNIKRSEELKVENEKQKSRLRPDRIRVKGAIRS